MDTIERSISVRWALWTLGFDAFLQTFPWGLGLGQFWEVFVYDLTLAQEGHKFAHNTFITFSVELGFLGLCLSIILLVVLLRAMKGWPKIVHLLFALLIFTPLILHDGHSIRMLLIIVAFGLVRFAANPNEHQKSAN